MITLPPAWTLLTETENRQTIRPLTLRREQWLMLHRSA